jgi:hypothetical protein
LIDACEAPGDQEHHDQGKGELYDQLKALLKS